MVATSPRPALPFLGGADPRSPASDDRSTSSNTPDRYYTPTDYRTPSMTANASNGKHFFPPTPKEGESVVEESRVGTSVVTEITSNALSAKMKFARLHGATRGEFSKHKTVMEDDEADDEGQLLDEKHDEPQLQHRKVAYATCDLCPVCMAPLLKNDSLAETLDPEETTSIIIHRSQSSSLVASGSTKMVSYAGDSHKMLDCDQQSGCSFMLPLSAFMDGLCVGPTTRTKESSVQAGHLTRHHSANELASFNPNDLPPYCGKCKSFVVSEGEDDAKRDQILLNLSSWLMSTGSKDEAEALGEGEGIEMQVLDDSARAQVVIVGEERPQDEQAGENEAINMNENLLEELTESFREGAIEEAREEPEIFVVEEDDVISMEGVVVGASDEEDGGSADMPTTLTKPDPLAEYFGTVGESGSVESIHSHDLVEYTHGTGHALMDRDEQGDWLLSQESTEIQAVNTLEEEKTIISHYEETRAIATKAIAKFLSNGFTLTQSQCGRCEMPLMEKDRKLHCVVCPNVLKKAKKRAHQKRTTPRSGAQKHIHSGDAHMKAGVSSKIMTKEKAEYYGSDQRDSGNDSISRQATSRVDHGTISSDAKEPEDAPEAGNLDAALRSVSFDLQKDHHNAWGYLRTVQTDAGVIEERDEHQVNSPTGDESSQRGVSDMHLAQSSLWDDMQTMDTANEDGQAASMVQSEDELELSLQKDSDDAKQSEPDIGASQAIYQRLIDGWLLTSGACSECNSRLMQSPEGIKECAFCNQKEYTARRSLKLSQSALSLDFQMDESTSGILVLSPVSGSSGMESMVDREYASSQLSPGNSGTVNPYTTRSPLAQLWYMPIPKDLDINDEQAVLNFIADSKKTRTRKAPESIASMHTEENSAFMSFQSGSSEDQQENLTDREHFASPLAYYRSPVGRAFAPTTPTISNVESTPHSANSKLKSFLDEALSPFPGNGYRDRDTESYSTQSDVASSPPDSPGTAGGVLTFSTWDERDPISEADSTDDNESIVVADEDGDDSDLILKFDHSLSLDDAKSPSASFPRGRTRQPARPSYSLSDSIPCTACGQALRQDEIIEDALCTNPQCSLFMIPTEMTGLFEKETRSDVSSFVPNTPYGRIEDLFALDFENQLKNITTPAHKISTELLERQLKQVEEPIREERDDEITRNNSVDETLRTRFINETRRMAASRGSTEVSDANDSEMQELFEKLQTAAKALKSLEEGVHDTEGSTTSIMS